MMPQISTIALRRFGFDLGVQGSGLNTEVYHVLLLRGIGFRVFWGVYGLF